MFGGQFLGDILQESRALADLDFIGRTRIKAEVEEFHGFLERQVAHGQFGGREAGVGLFRRVEKQPMEEELVFLAAGRGGA